MTNEDLRAAVATGILTEAQAARLTALATQRAAQRAALPQEDEPFEFFRGFAEIFIAVGLFTLFWGIAFFLWSYFLFWMFDQADLSFQIFGQFALVSLGMMAIAWWFATYFTLRRRMTLPSMVLASAYGIAAFVLAVNILEYAGTGPRISASGGFLAASIAMVLWYRRFLLPFSAFLTGVFLLGGIYFFAPRELGELIANGDLRAFFDLGRNPAFATATLLFGLGAFAVGMWFDTRDPHRLGRHSATAFWCHLLAAPALVNTVAVSLLNTGGGGSILLLTLALVIITLMALIIDRRSFLTAAIVYIAIVMSWFVGDTADFGTRAYILILLGALITAIGTWWVQLRATLMRALPDFPGKSRLPPYGSTE